MWERNDGSVEDYAIHNRFTAYLRVALEHNASQFIAKRRVKELREMELPGDDFFPNVLLSDSFDPLFIERTHLRLRRALSALCDLERYVLIEHILQDRTLKAIAFSVGVPYPTVKSIYRRVLKRLRKELMKDEF